MTSTALTPIEIEAAIVERLRATLQTAGIVKFVYDTKEYGAVEEESQLVPSVAVIYNGYQPGEQVGQGAVQAVDLEYLVVACARSSTDTLRASGAKDAASPIFSAALGALIGWKPAAGLSRLKLIPAPGAGYSDAGFTYVPIAFKTTAVYTPQP